MLKNQESALPVRKLMAAGIAGLMVAIIKTLLEAYYPDAPTATILENVDTWTTVGVMLITGYLTRERV